MKLYIDCDGVIFDSEKLLFNEEYYGLKSLGKITCEKDKVEFIKNSDWNKILRESEIINNSINILKSLRDFIILTKVNSLENEAVEKIKRFRELGIDNDIIFVPHSVKKTDVVDSFGNILIDDTIHNLDDWYNCGGIPIFFNKDNKDIDGWNRINIKYRKISSLDEVHNIKKLIYEYK